MNCAPNQSICDWYSNLLYERESVKKCCSENIKEIESHIIKTIDEKKLEGKLKIRNCLHEYIEKLNEKLDLLMAIMQDLSREYIQGKTDLSNLEQVLAVQKEALEKVESENQRLENAVNRKIEEIRENFITKWKELDPNRQEFEDVHKELRESCKKENDLELELKKKKTDLKRLSCRIKTLRDGLYPQKFTMKMFDKLRRNEKKYMKRYSSDLSSVQCYQQKMCNVQRELEIFRKIAKSKLKMVKLADEWRVEQREAQRKELEALKEESSLMFDNSEKVISSLMSKTYFMEKDVTDANRTIHNLQVMASSLLEKEYPCKKQKSNLRKKSNLVTKENVREDELKDDLRALKKGIRCNIGMIETTKKDFKESFIELIENK